MITEVPFWAGTLQNLEYLDVSNNLVDAISPAIAEMNSLDSLFCQNNRINSLPVTLVCFIL